MNNKITIELVENGWTVTSGDKIYVCKSPEKVVYYVEKLLGISHEESVTAEVESLNPTQDENIL